MNVFGCQTVVIKKASKAKEENIKRVKSDHRIVSNVKGKTDNVVWSVVEEQFTALSGETMFNEWPIDHLFSGGCAEKAFDFEGHFWIYWC